MLLNPQDCCCVVFDGSKCERAGHTVLLPSFALPFESPSSSYLNLASMHPCIEKQRVSLTVIITVETG